MPEYNAQFFVGLGVVALVLFWRFRRSKWRKDSDTGAAPSWLAAVDMLVIVLGAGAVAWMAVA